MRDLQIIVARLTGQGRPPCRHGTAGPHVDRCQKAFFDMLGVFAEFESQPAPRTPGRGDRGVEAARCLSRPTAQNRYGGHQATADQGKSPTRIAREQGVSRGTVYVAKRRCPRAEGRPAGRPRTQWHPGSPKKCSPNASSRGLSAHKMSICASRMRLPRLVLSGSVWIIFRK